jgi:CheY-like chemotaxis protein
MPKQILLADDSVTIHRVVEITFAREDYHITAVKNGDDALNRAKDLKPDVVLADANMPGKNGYDLCAALKADPGLSSVPCLILTGNFSPYDEVKGQKSGADGFVVKPFETQALIDKVADAIKRGGKAASAQPAAAAPTPPAPAAKPPVPMPVPQPQKIEPLSKPLSVVAAETSRKEPPSVEIEIEKPKAPAPAPVPIPQPRSAPAKTMMGFAAAAPPPNLAPSPPVPAPPPPAAAPPPASVKPAASIPANAPQMPRPSLIPNTPQPQPRAAAPVPMPSKPAPPAPRATLMGIPAVNPASLGPGAVPLPPSPVAPPKPAAPAWAPPPAATPAPAAASPSMAAAVSAVADRAQAEISAKGPEYDAVAKMSREVIERIAWEVVPELAETIIREQLDRLVKERNS